MICIDCPKKHDCDAYQNNIASDKAYYEWKLQVKRCKKEKEKEEKDESRH